MTILLSAFLLFQVQPLIAKVILPWFGGSANVWAAALLFFQIFLLAGYAYSHFLIQRFGPRAQMFVHVGLLAASCALLPILPSAGWKPDDASDPTLRILGLLAVTVGLPYFLLSSTSPLLQVWYARRTGSSAPYRLFALSNFGSLLGLLSFPFLVEPSFTSRQQAYGWSFAYVGFVVLCGFIAWTSRRAGVELPAPIAGGSLDAPVTPSTSGRPSIGQLALWVALAAVASTLLVASTTHLTQNVTPLPLLWVVPLALYLVTFVLAFEGRRLYRREIFVPLLTPSVVLMAYFVFNKNVPTVWLLPTFTLGMFVCCMVCHGELAMRRPGAEHLTLFYLMVSLGGAAGGLFVAVVAPFVFSSYLELMLGLVAVSLLAVVVLRGVKLPGLGGDRLNLLLFFGILMSIGLLVREQLQLRDDRALARNFYGALSVSDEVTDEPETAVRRLYHGTIEHGAQLLTPNLQDEPTSYYVTSSGIGRAFSALQERDDELDVGIVGLGAGVLSTYGRPGDSFRYYEINPEVVRLARDHFSYMEDSEARHEITLGDARLQLERGDERFELLVVDAFTGDAIPVHLLTREAFELYRERLAPDGVLAVHISNRYLDLEPVVARGAGAIGRRAVVVTDDGGRYGADNDWVLIARDDVLDDLAIDGARTREAAARGGFRAWTDDYSNIVSILILR